MTNTRDREREKKKKKKEEEVQTVTQEVQAAREGEEVQTVPLGAHAAREREGKSTHASDNPSTWQLGSCCGHFTGKPASIQSLSADQTQTNMIKTPDQEAPGDR